LTSGAKIADYAQWNWIVFDRRTRLFLLSIRSEKHESSEINGESSCYLRDCFPNLFIRRKNSTR
jgi:hypothetical protein